MTPSVTQVIDRRQRFGQNVSALKMKISIASELGSLKPFSVLSRQELERLAPSCTTRSLKTGELIY